jgi:hypothetical protein
VPQRLCCRHDPTLIIVRRAIVAATARTVSSCAGPDHKPAGTISIAAFGSAANVLNFEAGLAQLPLARVGVTSITRRCVENALRISRDFHSPHFGNRAASIGASAATAHDQVAVAQRRRSAPMASANPTVEIRTVLEGGAEADAPASMIAM